MLCFGNVNNNNTSISIDNNKKKLEEELGFVERGNKVIQKSGITGGSTDSSSASSSNNSSCSNSFTKSKRGQIGNLKQTEQEERDNGCGSNNPIPGVSGLGSTNSQTTKRTTTTTNKKLKKDTPPVKVRKEKIGERITALQQLVSPFGKVLSSPYLQKLPTSGPFAEGGRRAAPGTDGADLRSRGLCLVPIDYTLHVTSCNGADLAIIFSNFLWQYIMELLL
ncbi:hypothetical protein MKW94_029086 [Papaver nudicaule]|uniref:Uncharacterized protein n=1 Tax=Papaver nudicaule TaxID=74823 RepID=A0AA41V7D3_PAPNU|nr:hypothetical protein [Papaver nudicaule]